MEDYTFISSLETLVSAMVARRNMTKHLVLLLTLFCLQHEEWRSFTPHGSSEKQNRFGNAYYHCNSACVMSVWPSFIPTSVVVPVHVEVQSKLLPQHKEFLFASFGITV